MKTLYDYKIIGIDHGYGNMKTANCCFQTSVIECDTDPPFANDLLIWNNKYYSIGVGHKEFTADKFIDEDYYILAIAAIARELIDHIDVYEKEGGKKNYTQRIVIYYRFVGYLELPSSEDENYKANTRKGVDVEYIPTAKSA